MFPPVNIPPLSSAEQARLEAERAAAALPRPRNRRERRKLAADAWRDVKRQRRTAEA